VALRLQRVTLVAVVAVLGCIVWYAWPAPRDRDEAAEPGAAASGAAREPARVRTERSPAAADPPRPEHSGASDAAEDAGRLEGEGRLRITVLAGGKPLAGAEVRAYRREPPGVGGEPWRLSSSGVTDAAGTLVVAAAPGAWLVTAAARGFGRGYAEVARPSGEAITRVELRLAPGASLTGRTVERRSQAALALVELSFAPELAAPRFRRVEVPPGERAFATSDARGAFKVAGLAPGRWHVEARAPGHATTQASVVVPAVGELRVELAGAATIEGLVTRGGKPVAHATVTVTGAAGPVTVTGGPAGGFLAEVDPGTHRVIAQVGEETGAAEGDVVVAAGAHARGVEVQLGAPARIAGVVRSAAGPVAGAAVSASLAGAGAPLAQAVTDTNGRYDLGGLAPGSYWVVITVGGRARANYPGITLRAGERFPLNASLADPSAVEGTVTDANGAPVTGALVSAGGGWFRAGGGRGDAPLAARTDAAGHYRLEGVPGGPLRIAARRDDASPASTQMVTVEEGGTAHADLVLADGAVVTGLVIDARGNPIPGANVAAMDGAGAARRGGAALATADTSGSYLLAVRPGTYSLSAWRPDRPAFGPRPAVLASATVAVGQRAEVNLVVPDDPSPTVTGQVLEPGGTPSPGATVRASGAALQVVVAGGDGTFSLAVAVTDALTLDARNGGRTGSATVTPPASVVVVQLQPAAAVQGKLVGDPPPETFSLSASTTGAVGPGGPTRLQFAGAAFMVQDVAPGLVALHVATDDGRVGDAQVNVAAGEAKSADVALSPAATVVGRVVDASTGQPILRARILVDGVPRRAVLTSDGHFSRTVSAGDHDVGVTAAGYAPLTRHVSARPGTPNDLGDLPLAPQGAPDGGQ
jgi:hypothetical protein